MDHSGTVKVSLMLIGALGAPIPAAGQANDDFVEIGRAIAASLDSTNGIPVVARTGYDCPSHEICPNAADPTSRDVELANLVARGVAEGLDVALESPDLPTTRREWAPGDGDGTIGLSVRFGVISATEDTAEVMVSSGCRGFGQAYVYTLERSDGGGWTVSGNELLWIT